MTDEAIRFVEQQSSTSEPFFLYVPYTCPHSPFQGPNDISDDPLPLDSPLWDQGHAPPATYIAMIEQMDRRIGDLLTAIDQKGLAANTLVIFASDNGGTRSARNAPLSGHKGSTYEAGIRVPAMMRWPGVIPAGMESDQPCMTFDFTASIARIAGVTPALDQPWEGIDIVAHVAEGKPNIDRTLYWRKQRGENVWMAVREADLKWVGQSDGKKESAALFDLSDDVGEQHDLSQQRPADLMRLSSQYRNWEQRVRKHRRGQPGS